MNTTTATPTSEQDRIEALDVLRGFAVLGILLVNILGFALYTHANLNPLFNGGSLADLLAWGTIDLLVEGAMRALFSMLFGASLLLFTTGENAKGAWLHYKRNFWLLIFGLINVFVLMWGGDVLLPYALVGFLLYPLRNVRASRLYVLGFALMLAMSLTYTGMGQLMEFTRDLAYDQSTNGGTLTQEDQEAIEFWENFLAEIQPTQEDMAAELAARGGSMTSAYSWHFAEQGKIYIENVLTYIIWDAMIMMLIGMGLYKSGVMQGHRSMRFCIVLSLVGFTSGSLLNASEMHKAFQSGFAILETYPLFQFSYHFGRLAIAFGWLGLILALLKLGDQGAVRRGLAAVGRMALTNYLMHSLVFMLIFSGVGLGLVGQFSRSEVYVFVLAMWAFQLWFSPWWLARFHYGPLEWLWRGLTYGKLPVNSRGALA